MFEIKLFLLIGAFAIGFMVSTLVQRWKYYQKTGEFLQDVKTKQSSIFGVVQAKPEVCVHPFESVMSKCNGELNHCLKCGKHL